MRYYMLNKTGNAKLLFPVMFLKEFFTGFELGGFQYALLFIGKELGISSATMGGLVSAQFLALLLAPLFTGKLSDKVGKKIIIIVFSLILSIGCIIITASGTFAILAIGIFVLGIGFGATENASIAALSDAYGKNAGKYINIGQSGFGLGAVVAPLVSSFAINTLGMSWRAIFYAVAVAFVVVAILSAITGFTKVVVKVENKSHQKHGAKYFTPVLIGLMVCMFMYAGGENGTTFFMNTFFTDTLGSQAHAAWSLSVFWIAMAISRFVGGFLHRHQRYVVLFGFIGGATMMILMSMNSSPTIGIFICFGLGLMIGPVWPFLMSMGNAEFPNDTGFVSSILFSASSLGGTLIPPTMGGISDMTSTRAAYMFLAGLAAMAILVYFVSYFRVKGRREKI